MSDLMEKKSLDVLAAEIRAFTASMLTNVLEIGRRMKQAKEQIPYGEFGRWIQEETGYSSSTANNFMRLFEEYGSAQGSLFGAELDCQTFGKLSYSKALALLSVPAEERMDFVNEHHVEEMSTRELQKVIRERDEARRLLSEERAAAEGEALRVAELKESLSKSREEVLRSVKEAERAREELKRIMEAPVEVAVQAADPEEVKKAVKEALRKAKEDHQEEIKKLNAKIERGCKERERLKKMVDEAEKKVRKSAEGTDGQAERYRAEAEALRKELAMADPVVAEFKGLFEQASGLVVKLLELVSRAPEDKRRNLEAAMEALGKQMGGAETSGKS